MPQIEKDFSVADITISLKTCNDFALSSHDYGFRNCRDSNGSKRKMMNIHSVKRKFIDLSEYRVIYDNLTRYLWEIRQAKDGKSYLIAFYKDRKNNFKEPYKVIRLNENLTDIQIININGNKLVHPSEYLLVLIFSAYLNINKIGFILHAAMTNIDGKGYLFSGNSGDGKTTLTKLLMDNVKAEIITDERTAIRKNNESLFAYGTPWFGTKYLHKNKGVPVNKIFFLKHSKKNTVTKLLPVEAANRLIVRSFPAFWHKDGLQFALDFCSRIASEIECYEFGFVPDKSAVKYIMQLFN